MIDFKQIEAFVWVSELSSFSVAADKLNTTQPTISQRIHNLEQELGTRVFDRSVRGIKLTEKGQELLSHAKRMLELRIEIMKVAQSPNIMQGIFHLGVVETLAHTWFPSLVERLHKEYPALVIEIHVDTSSVLKEKLLNHQLDLILIVGRTIEDKTNSLSVGEYKLTWCASPKLELHDKQVGITEIANYPIITYPVGSLPYTIVRQLLQDHKIVSPRIYGSASLSTILHMVTQGMGSAVVPEILVKSLTNNNKLKILNSSQKLPPLIFYAHWLASPNSQRAKTVANLAYQISHASEGSVG